MSGRGGDHLATPPAAPSRLTAVDPSVRIACLLGFLVAVVATPGQQVWAFAVYAGLVVAAVATVRMPAGALGRRMLIETPFVLFALALPLLGSGPSRSVAGVELSIAGLWAAWTILAKATLGVAATALVAWSSSPAEILVGLERLRVPRALVAIAGFMVRYLEVVGAELARLQIARVSRADDPRWIWQGRAVAHTAGALFVRSFERGERVHQAMLARGFDGRFPSVAAPRRRSWWPAVVWPVTAALVAAVALAVELT